MVVGLGLRPERTLMNLNHLQYFLETCRYGSITKASEVCHISQPSITAAINNLEKELGAKLFDRVNNRLRLTVVGEGFKDLTEEFLKTFDDYCQSAYDIASSRYTKIRLVFRRSSARSSPKSFSGIFGAASKYPVRNRRGRIDRRA